MIFGILFVVGISFILWRLDKKAMEKRILYEKEIENDIKDIQKMRKAMEEITDAFMRINK